MKDKEVELGRLYKTKYKSLNMGDYLYPFYQYHAYTDGATHLVVVVKAIQINEGLENRITEIYSHQLKDFFYMVEDA